MTSVLDDVIALAAAQEKYIKFLSDANAKDAGYLYAHGIQASEEIVQQGIEFRAEIETLRHKIQDGYSGGEI